jgi:hypothetical protein
MTERSVEKERPGYVETCVRSIIESPDVGLFEVGDIVFVARKQGSKHYEWCFTASTQKYFPTRLEENEANAKIATGGRYGTGRWEQRDGGKWRLVPCRG